MYQTLEGFQTFMNEGSLAGLAAMLAVSLIGTGVAVAVHEAGHALAALLTGSPVHELRVGDSDDVTFTAGTFRLRLGRLRGDGEAAGYVAYDGSSATPIQIATIALAGPAANLLGAAAVAVPAVRAEGMLSVVLFLWIIASLTLVIANLRPSGALDSPAEWSDGRSAQLAWAAHRASLRGQPGPQRSR